MSKTKKKTKEPSRIEQLVRAAIAGAEERGRTITGADMKEVERLGTSVAIPDSDEAGLALVLLAGEAILGREAASRAAMRQQRIEAFMAARMATLCGAADSAAEVGNIIRDVRALAGKFADAMEEADERD